ncbi:MAG: hypothetical protein R3Y11_11020 [Pseudomonadota bacterium]
MTQGPTAAMLVPEPDEQDTALFQRLIDTTLTQEHVDELITPQYTYAEEKEFLAIHWHPQHVPLDLVKQRFDALFPNVAEADRLIIPTEHNVLHGWGDYAGVEVDCADHKMKLKVQLLLHFKVDAVGCVREELGDTAGEDKGKAHTLRTMLDHTARYRTKQLRHLLETAANPEAPQHQHRLERAVRASSATPQIVDFVSAQAHKLLHLLGTEVDAPTTDERRSTLLRDTVEAQRATLGPLFTAQVHAYTKALRGRVKAEFPLDFFYTAQECIEEARALGAMVTIPHPEQFWPILLANYDADGVEVWNPQSKRHTDFLIATITETNRRRAKSGKRKPIIVTTGDDCHVGEMVQQLVSDHQRPVRELGVQGAWSDDNTLEALHEAGISRQSIMRAVRERLG